MEKALETKLKIIKKVFLFGIKPKYCDNDKNNNI